MGKGHKDNHSARVKIGKIAFDKKQERRKPKSVCNICGKLCRPTKLQYGVCPECIKKLTK